MGAKRKPAALHSFFKRSKRWSILPAYTVDGYISFTVHHGSITTGRHGSGQVIPARASDNPVAKPGRRPNDDVLLSRRAIRKFIDASACNSAHRSYCIRQSTHSLCNHACQISTTIHFLIMNLEGIFIFGHQRAGRFCYF